MDENRQISFETQRFAMLLIVHGTTLKQFLALSLEKQLVAIADWDLSLEQVTKCVAEINAIQHYLIVKFGAVPGASGAN